MVKKVKISVTCDAFCDGFCDASNPHKYRGFNGGVTGVTEKIVNIYTRARVRNNNNNNFSVTI